MKKITIGFSKPKQNFKLFSLAIQWIEQRPFSHSYIVIDDMVYHAAHGMIHCVYLANFTKNNQCIISYDIEITEENFNNAFLYLKQVLGITYGFDQIFGIFLQKIFRKKEAIIHNNSQRMICSEFCARYLVAAGLDISVEFDSITPSDLQEILELNYGKDKTKS